MGDVFDQRAQRLDAAEERLDALIGQARKLATDARATQDILDLGQDRWADIEGERSLFHASKAGERRARLVGGGLKEDHAIENHPHAHGMSQLRPRRLSVLDSTRASSRSVSRSFSVIPLWRKSSWIGARISAAVRAGIHRRTLSALREAGLLEQLSRGLYRLAEAPPLAYPDLVAVAGRVPKGVVCLISALAFHELTTQVPHQVDLAVPRDCEPPRIDYPPTRIVRWGPRAYGSGIERRVLDGFPVPIYGREKTLADCFRYRSAVGLDTVLEALRRYKRQGRVDAAVLLEACGACRVAMTMRPYLEAVL